MSALAKNLAGARPTQSILNPGAGDDFVVRNAAQNQVRNIYTGLWDRGGLAGFLGGQMPSLAVRTGVMPANVVGGWVQPQLAASLGNFITGPQRTVVSPNAINLTPNTVAALINPHDPMHGFAQHTLIHESAHTRQSARTNAGGVPAIEGGAEAFARDVAPQVYRAAGIRFDGQGGAASYTPLARAASKRGIGWVLRNQFGDGR